MTIMTMTISGVEMQLRARGDGGVLDHGGPTVGRHRPRTSTAFAAAGHHDRQANLPDLLQGQ